MEFAIINNLIPSQNHSARLKELFLRSDSVIIASPFLMGNFTDFLSELDFRTLEHIHLITTLVPQSFDQIKKINSLVSLIDFQKIKDKEIDCRISINNRLHGKVYIFKKTNVYLAAIVTSANFTDSGLSRNHEWGIEFTDENIISKLEQSLINSIEIEIERFEEIYLMQKKANDFLDKEPQKEIRLIELDLTEFITTTNWDRKFDNNVDYFLKPIGYTDAPIKEDTLFNSKTERLNFSKKRPTGVKPDDVVIAYGVGTTKILSIYRVTSYPIHVTEEEIEDKEWLERWPWYVNAENITTTYGEKWSQYNFKIGNLRQEFLNVNPNSDITAVGGKTLGSLNFGQDKLKLSEDFAQFIIQKINNAV